MANSKLVMPLIIKWEGGYSNHPNDKGGCTMKGVTIGTFRKFYGAEKNCSDLKQITDEQWLNIFETGFWNVCNGDEIANQSIANIIVDWAWNSGPQTAIKKVQQILEVEKDGKMGPITISKLNNYNQKELFKKIYLARTNFYINICKKNESQKVFLKGWMNRLADYKFSENPKVEITVEEEKITEKIKQESYEEIKKHFTDIMLDFGQSFLFK